MEELSTLYFFSGRFLPFFVYGERSVTITIYLLYEYELARRECRHTSLMLQ